ncbi:MAG: DNA repair protein RecO [Actinobacteria bacterium]|nr:MAG: DNA repair protein RecO [Actinomycetota bacterium]
MEPDPAPARRPRLGRVARSYKTEAVVLRSFRLGEADRVLHLYTLDRGRVGAVAKGVRKTKSRFGARLEPFSHVELLLHQGSGELHTVTGASLVDPHRPAREDRYRLSVGLVGAEAMLRLFVEQEENERAFEAVTRFLDAVDAIPAGLRGRASLDPLALAFQLKLLWLSGYLPHLEACVECGATEELVGYLASAGGAVCVACARAEAVELAPEGFRGVRALLMSPLARARELALGDRAARDALAVIVTSYEFHGGFRLRTLSE